ncbi:MAG: helix-turn-helix domain-containing protein [Thermoplasmata archaeon]|nr:helix-turn-helix domain-containing protein [Thermoplasmata archaeon]
MRIEITKEYTREEMERERNAISKEYGGLHPLSQRIATIGCTRPEYIDAYMTLRALSSKNPTLTEKTVFHGAECFEKMTPRRMELLDYLSGHTPSSITELARTLKRDYKNVYDDLRALRDIGLVDLRRERNRLVPTASATDIHIYVEGGHE